MNIDPNISIEHQSAYVLCEQGKVLLHNGSSISQLTLQDENSAFIHFCRSLNPNKCFISALIPDDADKNVFFKARDVAHAEGIHMQANVDRPEQLRKVWGDYLIYKSHCDSEVMPLPSNDNGM
ncbi:MAG: hypothetical protein methR_P0608 [Methyloprofundus sp.]|nr:MAG: hypothetical protein methR_P0608 [Methyloprofundus sp.]